MNWENKHGGSLKENDIQKELNALNAKQNKEEIAEIQIRRK